MQVSQTKGVLAEGITKAHAMVYDTCIKRLYTMICQLAGMEGILPENNTYTRDISK